MLGIWASLPPNNITLNPAESDFQTVIDAALHATLDTDQLITPTRVPLVDTIASLQSSEEGVIAASEVHELTDQINDILDSGVSKQDGNMVYILAYCFKPASREHCEVWASQFPFLYKLKDTVPCSEPCLYGYIDWSLAQAYQESSLGLFQSSTKGWFNVEKLSVQGSGGASLAKKLCLDTRTKICQGGRKSAGDDVPDVIQSVTSSPSSSPVVQVGIFPNCFRSMEKYYF